MGKLWKRKWNRKK